MPFITEELYTFWNENKNKGKEKNEQTSDDDFVIISSWPQKIKQTEIEQTDKEGWKNTEKVLHLIYKIRNIRSELQIPPGEKFAASTSFVDTANEAVFNEQKSHIENLARLSSFTVISDKDEDKKDGFETPFDYGKLHLDITDLVDLDKEKSRLDKEIQNLEKYVTSLNQKLSNQNFVDKAPAELIAEEKKKKADAEEKLNSYKTRLESFQ